MADRLLSFINEIDKTKNADATESMASPIVLLDIETNSIKQTDIEIPISYSRIKGLQSA